MFKPKLFWVHRPVGLNSSPFPFFTFLTCAVLKPCKTPVTFVMNMLRYVFIVDLTSSWFIATWIITDLQVSDFIPSIGQG